MKRIWIKYGVMFLFLGVIGLPLHGQQLDLIQSLEIAKEKYPSIRAKATQLEASTSEYKASRNVLIPRLTLQHQYTYSTSNSVEGGFYPTAGVLSPSGGIRPDNIYTGTFGSFTSALMEWDVFGFGKLSNQVKAAKADVSVNQMDLENELLQHQVRVADAYLLLLASEKLTQAQEANEERAESFNNAVNAAVQSQLRSEVDGSLARSEYERARILLMQSRQIERTGRIRLMELLGMDPGSDTIEIDTMNFYSELPDPETSTPAISGNPLLRLQEARIEAAHYQANTFKSSALPVISLVAAGWARGSGISNTDGSINTDFSSGAKYQVKNYLLGVSARWTITDGFSAINRSNRFESIAKQNSEVYNQQNLQLQRQLSEAQSQYQVMLEQAEAVQLQLNAARQAYAQANARYSAGLTDLPTLLQSMVGLNQAEADRAVTYSNAWRSLLSIAMTCGDLSIFTSAIQ